MNSKIIQGLKMKPSRETQMLSNDELRSVLREQETPVTRLDDLQQDRSGAMTQSHS
jgi:hypothetical protein